MRTCFHADPAIEPLLSATIINSTRPDGCCFLVYHRKSNLNYLSMALLQEQGWVISILPDELKQRKIQYSYYITMWRTVISIWFGLIDGAIEVYPIFFDLFLLSFLRRNEELLREPAYHERATVIEITPLRLQQIVEQQHVRSQGISHINNTSSQRESERNSLLYKIWTSLRPMSTASILTQVFGVLGLVFWSTQLIPQGILFFVWVL